MKRKVQGPWKMKLWLLSKNDSPKYIVKVTPPSTLQLFTNPFASYPSRPKFLLSLYPSSVPTSPPVHFQSLWKLFRAGQPLQFEYNDLPGMQN